jgi:hypothetical protein
MYPQAVKIGTKDRLAIMNTNQSALISAILPNRNKKKQAKQAKKIAICRLLYDRSERNNTSILEQLK